MNTKNTLITEPETAESDDGMLHCELRIGWLDGCEAANGDDTGIRSQDDLADENKKFVRYRFAIPATAGDFAWNIGLSLAFQDNFFARDTCSMLFIDGKRILPGELPVLRGDTKVNADEHWVNWYQR